MIFPTVEALFVDLFSKVLEGFVELPDGLGLPVLGFSIGSLETTGRPESGV